MRGSSGGWSGTFFGGEAEHRQQLPAVLGVRRATRHEQAGPVTDGGLVHPPRRTHRPEVMATVGEPTDLASAHGISFGIQTSHPPHPSHVARLWVLVIRSAHSCHDPDPVGPGV